MSTAPAKITTTNYGTLVERTGLGPIGACTSQCGEWRYDPRLSWVQLPEFYWQKTNGTQVLATNLVPALANTVVGDQRGQTEHLRGRPPPRLIARDPTAAPPPIPLPRPGRNTDGTAVRQSSSGAGRDPF